MRNKLMQPLIKYWNMNKREFLQKFIDGETTPEDISKMRNSKMSSVEICKRITALVEGIVFTNEKDIRMFDKIRLCATENS